MSTTTIVTGYCPMCQHNVLLTREKMDFCIALMLLIFTAGIGLIFYYYAREKNRCVHCGSICQFQIPDIQNESLEIKAGEVKGIKLYYCQYCGAEIEERVKDTCPSCGSQNKN